MQDAEGEPDLAERPMPCGMNDGDEESDLDEEALSRGGDDPWGRGDGGDPWASATPPPPPKPVGVPAPKQLPQAGSGGAPAEPQQVWGNFQAGQAQAPEASWKEGGGGRGGGKGNRGGSGGGKGNSWGSEWSWKDKQPSGPNLPRKRVSTTLITGEVVEWKGKYGWIQPTEPFQHPKANQRSGRIFVSRTDLVHGRELVPGTVCHFYVFEDEAGLGAEECAPVDQPGGRDGHARGPAPPMQNRQSGFNRPPAASGAPRPSGPWGGKSWDGGKGPSKGSGPQPRDGRPDAPGRGMQLGGGGGGRGSGRGLQSDGRKGRGKGGHPSGGDEFSLPGYVNLKQQGKGGCPHEPQMPLHQGQAMMGGLHQGLPDDSDVGGLQAGMQGLQLGPRDMQPKREAKGRGRGGGRGGGGPRGTHPAAEDPPPGTLGLEPPDAFGLPGCGDLAAAHGRYMAQQGTLPGPGGLPLHGLPLSGQNPLGALPGGPGGLPAGHLALPGGQSPGWPMQPLGMDPLLGGGGSSVGMGMPGSLAGLSGAGPAPPPPPQQGGLGMLRQLPGGGTAPAGPVQPGWGAFMPANRLPQGMPGQPAFGSW